jgi:hypothetical protein
MKITAYIIINFINLPAEFGSTRLNEPLLTGHYLALVRHCPYYGAGTSGHATVSLPPVATTEDVSLMAVQCHWQYTLPLPLVKGKTEAKWTSCASHHNAKHVTD